MISLEDYQRLQQEAEQSWAAVDRLRARNVGENPEDVLRVVTAEVEAVRQERYAEQTQATKGRRYQSPVSQ